MTELGELLDKTTATQRMNAAGIDAIATPLYVRHKPGETTIIAYQFDLADDTSTHGYAHWCHHSARADQIYAKAKTLRPRPSPIGQGLDRLDAHTVLYSFPNDARLRRLRWYCETRKLRRSLVGLIDPNDRISRSTSTARVLRYKPERRLVAHVSLRTDRGISKELLMRYTTKPHACGLHHLAAHLRTSGINTPTPLARLEVGRVSVDEFIEGRQLREAIAAGDASADAVAAAVVGFHAVAVPENTELRTRAAEGQRSTTALSGLARWRPELSQRALTTTRLLQRNEPPEHGHPRLLHGDLHTKNLLQTKTGVSFVDLERMSAGDPAIDLGYFLAHGIARPIRCPGEGPIATEFAHHFIEIYRQQSHVVSDAALAWHTAIGLIDQALLAARHLEADWQTTTRQLLEIACKTLSQTRTSTRMHQP